MTSNPPPSAPSAGWISHDDAVSDLRQLASAIEATHPEPYRDFSGRIGYHEDVRKMISQVPAEGMRLGEFQRVAQEFASRQKDGHTWIRPLPSSAGAADDARLWVDFSVIEEALYVSAVYREEDRKLIGRRLRSINGIMLSELISRAQKIRAADNPYGRLELVSRVLKFGSMASSLLRLEGSPAALGLEFESDPSWPSVKAHLPFAAKPPGNRLTAPSKIQMPSLNSAGMGWSFISPDKSTALLKIDRNDLYREAFENWRHFGQNDLVKAKLQEVDPSGETTDLDERLLKVPSATELFKELFSAMKSSKTKTLIVDVREDEGGYSMLTYILAYFLYPKGEVAKFDYGYQIPRYSQLYFDNYTANNIDSIRKKTGQTDFQIGDYDFSEVENWKMLKKTSSGAFSANELQASTEASPTFAKLFADESWSAVWKPQVIVVTSAKTYSAGYEIAAMLKKAGEKLVGVPSSQAGNCFIDTLAFTLPNSRLTGRISYKKSLLFPEDEKSGNVLRPHVELGYRKLKDLGFDPNASVLLAVDSAL